MTRERLEPGAAGIIKLRFGSASEPPEIPSLPGASPTTLERVLKFCERNTDAGCVCLIANSRALE